MATNDLSRLSDLNIHDDILRAVYYQRVMEFVKLSGNEDLNEYTIRLDETYRPDLSAFRAFGSSSLDWLICLVCDVDDVSEPLPVGRTVSIPTATWVRSSMRQFMDEMGLMDG